MASGANVIEAVKTGAEVAFNPSHYRPFRQPDLCPLHKVPILEFQRRSN